MGKEAAAVEKHRLRPEQAEKAEQDAPGREDEDTPDFLAGAGLMTKGGENRG